MTLLITGSTSSPSLPGDKVLVVGAITTDRTQELWPERVPVRLAC